MGWIRKHICDLAGVFKVFGADDSLTLEQRKKFVEAYAFAKHYTSIPNAGGTRNVTTVISMGCSACKEVLHHDCIGRDDWKQSCKLMQTLQPFDSIAGISTTRIHN